MAVIETKLRKWGNSFGAIIPRHVMEANKIKEEDTIRFIIIPDSKKVFKDTFGMLKGKLTKSTQQMKDELRRELYDD